jgi:carboxyl-terminal processing protease
LKRVLVIIFLLLAIPCSLSQPQSFANAFIASLSAKDRIDVFETVWKTINDEYYDPKFNGVDWAAIRERYRPRVEAAKDDDEFYGVINQMLLELQDLHTSFVAPNQGTRSSGISVSEIEQKIVVVDVDPDSDAARAGVKPGMIVRTFDGKTIDQRAAEVRTSLGKWANDVAFRFLVSRRLFAGPANSTFKLGLERQDGSVFDVTLTRRTVATPEAQLTTKRLPSGIVYMKVNNALRSPVEDQFKSEFKSLKDAPGLIIDLRGVSGGNIIGSGLPIANHFFSTKVSFGKFITRSGDAAPHRSLSAGGSDDVYKGPMVIIVDESTRSAGEVFAAGFQENARAKIVGSRSCGCVLDREGKKVKGDGVLQYSHFGFISANGRKLEGSGIVPDEAVPLTIEALRQGRDVMLEAAERLIKAK